MHDLFGYQEFNDPEAKDAPKFYVSLVFTLIYALLLLLLVNKKGWKSSVYYVFALLVMTTFFAINAVEFLNKENYYRAFDEVEWNQTADKKPLVMARWMEKNNFGLGWSKNEVTQHLGNTHDPEHNLIRFQLELPYGYLDYVFDNGKVIKVNMWCECD